MKKNIVKEIVLLVIFCLLSTTMTFAQSLGREKISQFLKTYEELIVDVEKLAEKNSVNEFLKFQQKYVELSEKLTEMITTENMDAIEEYAKRVNVSEKGWTLKLYGEMGNPENLKMFLQTVAYVYSRDVDQKKAAESLQVCLHRVKNYYSKLRLNGTEIHRPANEGEYMEECVKVFGEMMDCLEENHLEEGVHVLARFISEEIAAAQTGEEKA